MKNKQQTIGFTLIEMIVVIGLISVIITGIGIFATQGSNLWRTAREQSVAQEETNAAFRRLANEIREMIIADNGSYPLEITEDATIVFFANVDNDAKREKIKYELVNGALYRSVVKSDNAQPPQYPAFNLADRQKVAEHLVGTAPLFQYYNRSYNGQTAPLTRPFEAKDVTLIKIHTVIDANPAKPPDPVETETNVSLRNLKYIYD